MTTVPAKPHQPLHNFSLPFLKWGQRSHANTSNRCRRLLSTSASPAPDSEDLSDSDQEKSLGRGRTFDGEREVKAWNLRPRRSAIGNQTASRSLRAAVEEDNKKRKLWISLSKEEIEEDVYALTGSKAARRPKKRNKNVQKQVDNLFPGVYLVGILASALE